MIKRKEQPQLAERLRKMRTFKRLSQEHVAKEIGLSRAALSAIENGKRRVDSLELLALARVYRYPAAFFLGETRQYAGAMDPLTELVGQLDDPARAEVYRFAEYLVTRRAKAPRAQR